MLKGGPVTMRATSWMGIAARALAAAGAAWAAGTFQPLNIRSGLWEITLTVRTRGAPPLTADLLARLTPEQRARMAARARAAPQSETTVKRSCLSESELRQPLVMAFPDTQGCRQTVVTASATRQQIRVVCGDGSAGGVVTMQATGSENARVVSRWNAAHGPNAVTLDSTATLKWLGPSCDLPAAPPPVPAPAAPHAAHYYELGRQQSAHDDYQQAVRSLTRAIELDPRRAEAYNARGYAYLRLRNLAAAIADFSQAIRLRPGYTNAYQNRAIARRRAGDPKGAADDQRRAANHGR